MLQNPRKTLGFKKNMVYKIPPGGEVNHIKPVAYTFFKTFFKNYIRVSNSLDPDQARHYGWPDLDLNCLQRL